MDDYTALIQRFGPLIGGADLVKVLGFRTRDAFYKARKRGKLNVDAFNIEGRRGLFCRTEDVAKWLAQVKEASTSGQAGKEPR